MRVLLVVFDDCLLLDVAGPSEVFAAAGAYDVIVASVAGGHVRTTGKLALATRALRSLRPRAEDTVLVVGGERAGVERACADSSLIAWLARAAHIVRRIGSICTGAFVLAATGLLEGRRVATHWSACERLAADRRGVQVDRDAIFIEDGRFWTSAGVTTGIDMSLAMVEADRGRRAADAVAAELVLYTRRLGFQSQWSDALVAQVGADDQLAAAIAWARGHLAELDVARLARRAGMSERSFHRHCVAQLRVTPAKLIEQLRVEHARSLLAASRRPIKTVARLSGFRTSARMSRAFRRTLGLVPTEYERRFG